MLLVSAAIGGGHDAFSRALAERLEARGAVVAIDDFYDAAIPHLSKVISKLNRAWLLHFGRLYQWVWDHLVRRGPFAWLATTFFRLTGALVVRKLVKRHRPHVVVATYPMCVAALARLRRKGRLAAPVVSYPNDFQAHLLWVADGVDLYLAPTDEVKRWLEDLAVGAPIRQVGIPVRTAFLDIPDKAAARSSLGFNGDRPVVLATAGGDGVGHLDELIEALADLPVDVAVICGRNKGLRRRVEQVAGDGAVVVGFVDDVERWLAAADVLVGTPGPNSASEAFCAGTPVVSYRPYAGHGIDNADWVARSGAGWVVHDPSSLHDLVTRLLRHPRELATAAERAAAVARPGAADDAADEILSTIGVVRAPARRWPRRVAVAAAVLAAAVPIAIEVPPVAAGTLHIGVVRHVNQPGHHVGVMVMAPGTAVSAERVADEAAQHGAAVTYLTACGRPDGRLLNTLAARGVDVGVVGDAGLVGSPGGVRDSLRACRQAIEHAGATGSAFLANGDRYSWGEYVGSRGWRRMSPAQVVDLRVGEARVSSSVGAGDVVLFVLSADQPSRAAFGRALDEMEARGLVPVSITGLLSPSG